jgi:NADH-quinone oxidoreductase subunit C
MDLVEHIKTRLQEVFPDAKVTLVQNPNPAGQPSFAVDNAYAVAIAMFLREDPELRLDYCSNVTGVDRLDRGVNIKEKIRKVVDGKEQEVEEVREEKTSGYLEAVYHLYSVAHKRGPVIIRTRTADRAEGAVLPSLTPVFRSAELQEREIFDLYGVRFEGHPDLRRILMWDEFTDYPMRKDYQQPDDYEYEPTPHGDVLQKSKWRDHTEERSCTT